MNMSEAMGQSPDATVIDIATHNLIEVRLILTSLIKALNAGPKSRARSLVITKLEEANMWANEGLRLE
jgi:hypothetical protein